MSALAKQDGCTQLGNIAVLWKSEQKLAPKDFAVLHLFHYVPDLVDARVFPPEVAPALDLNHVWLHDGTLKLSTTGHVAVSGVGTPTPAKRHVRVVPGSRARRLIPRRRMDLSNHSIRQIGRRASPWKKAPRMGWVTGVSLIKQWPGGHQARDDFLAAGFAGVGVPPSAAATWSSSICSALNRESRLIGRGSGRGRGFR